MTIYFFIWTHGEESLEKFLEDLDECDENLKFIHESSKENISFLDLDVKFMDGKLTTDSQIKPTDKHQYLHFSSHSDHTKVNKNSQTFWLSKIYTFEMIIFATNTKRNHGSCKEESSNWRKFYFLLGLTKNFKKLL